MARALEGMGCVEVVVNEPCPRRLDAHVAGSLSGASVVLAEQQRPQGSQRTSL